MPLCDVRTLVLMTVATLAFPACGSEPPPSAGSDSVQYPATSLEGLPVTGGSVPTSPVFIDDADRCPERDKSLSFGDGSAMGVESSRLEPMLGRVLAYGTEHTDEFGTYGLIWLDAGDASVFISMTGNLDAHRAALTQVVDFPDELIVCQAALSGTSNQALQDALVQELSGRFIGIGQGYGSVDIQLPANEEQLAAELVARYGDIVTLQVGNFDYPLSPGADPVQRSCVADLTGPTEMGGLRATLAFDAPSFGAGNDISGMVTVTNTGDRRCRKL